MQHSLVLKSERRRTRDLPVCQGDTPPSPSRSHASHLAYYCALLPLLAGPLRFLSSAQPLTPRVTFYICNNGDVVTSNRSTRSKITHVLKYENRLSILHTVVSVRIPGVILWRDSRGTLAGVIAGNFVYSTHFIHSTANAGERLPELTSTRTKHATPEVPRNHPRLKEPQPRRNKRACMRQDKKTRENTQSMPNETKQIDHRRDFCH